LTVLAVEKAFVTDSNLAKIVRDLVAPGQGILAVDEGNPTNVTGAHAALLRRAACNAAASRGTYTAAMEG
jgi:hypothetical protein